MSTSVSPTANRVRQTRKSIGHLPSADTGGNKENATLDSATLSSLTTQSKNKIKKSRSKSIGPGGLDALKEGSGNVGEPAPRPNVKSILKTSSFFSPPKYVPGQSDRRTPSPGRRYGGSSDKSPQRSPTRRTPEKQNRDDVRASGKQLSPGKLASPARSPSRAAVRTEKEQEAAAREQEQREKLARKEARRKSLATRRVSFAPEATLHTWNVVELPEDSTTSSASTNSTRRASGLTNGAPSPSHGSGSPTATSDPSEPPSTPPEQVEELQVAASPAHQRDLHQKKRRRSSAVPPMNFNDPNEFSSSPASVMSDDTGPQVYENADEATDSSDSDDKDLEEDETVTALDGDESTTQSAGGSSTSSSGRLDAALAQAARQAGTQGIDFDENGDITMEMADDEITNAFQPWAAKAKQDQQNTTSQEAQGDQENVNPFLSLPNGGPHTYEENEGEGTMEMTRAVGGILSALQDTQTSPKRGKRKSIGGHRRSSIARRRSSGDASAIDDGDESMELTMAIGAIEEKGQVADANEHPENDEELTMEFTSVLGGVVQPGKSDESSLNQSSNARDGGDSTINGEEMDMTYAGGGILAPISEITEPIEDQTMDITKAVGAILPQELSTGNKAEAKALMELETDMGQLSASPFRSGPLQKPMGAGLNDERPLPALLHKTTTASETGSPKLMSPRTRSSPRRGVGPRKSVTPKALEKQVTPVKKPGTPSKQQTPQNIRPSTPNKTPPSKNVTMRSASPKRLFKAEIKAVSKPGDTSTPKTTTTNPFFKRDSVTGVTTPNIILQPRGRRSSGLGADREGLGSPRVTELLDRRGSIGDNAKVFVPQSSTAAGIRFENPQIMEQEIDRERREDERRESGRDILQGEVDSQDQEGLKDVTANLRDMIGSLTPQKKKLNGRKSLAKGTAKGLLGKRPAELDEDDDDSTQRLKGREGSPVKKVKLPAPPAKSVMTGRILRPDRKSLLETDGNANAGTPSSRLSPSKNNTTPKEQPRFKDAERQSPAKVSSFEQKLEGSPDLSEPPEEEDRIHLQDFLNMTNIRFIELTTTKRRHTVAPNALAEQSQGVKENEAGETKSDLESCVVAGTCTVPILELYQHSCRELKNYIAEGRSIVKEIETDTYEENPPLFREYMSAPADVKPIMDNQFKNVKTHARYLSKAMWYEWRMKLLDGLKEGLTKIGEDMQDDHKLLFQQEQLLQPVLPVLIDEHESLENQAQIAQAQADELADCDQAELKSTRETLVSVEYDLEEKQRLVEKLQNELREKEDHLEDILSRKQRYNEEIKNAEKVLQECHGWSAAEVASLRANVDALEAAHGWTVSSVDGSALTMTYKRSLELYFTPSAFLSNNADLSAAGAGGNSPIGLAYTPSTLGQQKHLTTEKRFFLQIMRAALQGLPQHCSRLKDLLGYVSHSWDVACAVSEEVRILGLGYITDTNIIADDRMKVESVVLLPEMRTKVLVALEVSAHTNHEEKEQRQGMMSLRVGVSASAKVVYGEALKEGKMAEFLEGKIKALKIPAEPREAKVEQSAGVWAAAVRALEEKCLARGKK